MSSDFDVKFNKSVLCTELTSGKKHSGNFLFGDDGITTTLMSLDEPFSVSPESPIVLVTEELAVVSLYDSFSGSTETKSASGRPIQRLHTQKIISNTAIIGADEWTADNRVKRVSFCLHNSMVLLRNPDKVARLSLDRVESENDDWLLLNFKANGMVVRLFYAAKYERWRNEPTEIEPWFELEFDEAIQLGKHMEPVNQVASFCSMALGVPLLPSEVKISRQSLSESLADLNINRPPTYHRVLYRRHEFKVDSSEIRIYGSPVNAHEGDELKNLGECLREWLERGSKWNDAYTLMMGALVRRNEFGAERLLNACKWFESLPNAKPEQVLDTETLNQIVNAAVKAANCLGVNDVESRITSSLRSIGQESRAVLFKRLIGPAWNPNVIPYTIGDIVSHLSCAFKLRGKAAHGNLRIDGDDEAKNILLYIAALEALCLLLTVRDLPLSAKGRQRMKDHPVVANYRWAV